MRLKYEKVIHHAIVNNLFGTGYTKRAVTLKVVVNTTYSLQPLHTLLNIDSSDASLKRLFYLHNDNAMVHS